MFLTYPFVIAASKDAPYQTMAELAEHAKTNKVVLGHFGAPLIPTKVTLALAKKMGFSYASDAAFDMLEEKAEREVVEEPVSEEDEPQNGDTAGSVGPELRDDTGPGGL